MGFDFNQIKNGITSVGKDIGNKVSDVSAVAKVKLDIHSKEDYMEKQFAELGKAYYQAHKDEEDMPEKALFSAIADAEAEIARLKDELMTLQGAQTCPSCGHRQSQGHAYCENCGTKLQN